MYLAGGNNVTLSQNANSVTISGPNTVAQTQFVLSNSNGISFGTNGSTVTATVRTDYQSAGAYLTTAMQSDTPIVQSINGSSGTFSLNTGSSLSSSRVGNAITFGLASNVTTALQSAGAYLTTARASNDAIGLNTAQSNVTWTVNSSGLSLDARGYAGTGTTGTNATFTLNSNGLQLNAGAYLTTAMASNRGTDFVQANAAFAGTNASGTIASNGISVSVNPAAAGVGIVAGTRTATTAGELLFDNANGVSFGLNAVGGSIMTASHNGITSQSNQNVSLYALGNTTQNSSTVLNASNLSFNAIGSITAGYSNGSIQLSAPNALTTAMASNRGTDFVQANAVFNGTNASGTIASNAISVSVANPVAQTNQTVGGYFVGNTTGQSSSSTVDARSISIDGAGIVSAGWSNGSIRISATQSNQAFSGSNGSFTFQTATLGNLNGMSFYTSNGSMVGSYTVPTVTNSSLTMQAGASTLSSVSRVAFSDANGVSFLASTSNNGSITISASHNGLTSQSNQAFSASGGSSAFQTLNFANSNGLTFSNSNGSVIGSYTVPSVTQYFSATNTTFNGTNVSGSITLNTNGIRVDVSAGAGGGVTPVASASNGSFSFTTLGFSNANNVTFGTSAGSIITASVAPPGAAAENNAINLLGANTAGNTTATGSTIGWSGINLTLSGTNGSAVNISAPATSSLSATGAVSISTNGSTISIGAPAAQTLYDWDNMDAIGSMNLISNITATAFSGGRPWFIPVQVDGYLSFNRLQIDMSRSTSGSNAFTVNFGLYSFSNSTRIDLIGSFQNAFSASDTASVSGIRRFELSHTNTALSFLAPGHYIAALGFSANGGNTASMNYSIRGGVTASPPVGLIGQGSNNNTTATSALSTLHLREFRGLWSTTTAAMPSSVSKAHVSGWTTGGHPYIWMGSR